MGFGIDSQHHLEHLGARAHSRRHQLLEESLIRRQLGLAAESSVLASAGALAGKAIRSLARAGRRLVA